MPPLLSISLFGLSAQASGTLAVICCTVVTLAVIALVAWVKLAS